MSMMFQNLFLKWMFVNVFLAEADHTTYMYSSTSISEIHNVRGDVKTNLERSRRACGTVACIANSNLVINDLDTCRCGDSPINTCTMEKGMFCCEYCCSDTQVTETEATNDMANHSCPCSSTEYVAVPASATEFHLCSALTVCTPTEFVVLAPTATTNRFCHAYTTCTTTEFQAANPTAISDRACVPIAPPCDNTEFQVYSPTPTSDRICLSYAVCNYTTQFEVATPTLTTDRVCLQLSPPCDFSTEFQVASSTPTSDRICTSFSVCNYTTQYRKSQPTTTSDRICNDLTVCVNNEYASVAPTMTSNRQCRLIRMCSLNTGTYITKSSTPTSDTVCSLIAALCDPTTQFQSVAPSINTNRNCTSLTQCSPQYQYQSEPPTTTTDRQCSYLTNCSSLNEMQMHAPTPTSNRMCGNSTIVTAAKKLSTSSDAGIAIGVIVVLLMFTVAAIYLVCQKRTTEEDLRLNEQLLQGERAEKASLFAENMEMKSAWEIDEADLVTEEILASGAMGVVWRATWGHIQVAMKILKTPVDDDFGLLVSEEFNREVSFMQKIRHPNLLIFYGAGITSTNMAFLVTEYMAKGSLRGVLKSSNSVTLSVEIRQNMALDCARGMRHLHSLGSIHRDLKSDNCLVDDNLRVKVADFGESCLIRNAQSRMNMHSEEVFDVTANPSVSLTRGVGTPLWMAPELFSKSIKYGPEIDVYSFGIVMWELITMKQPWADDIKKQGVQFSSAMIEAVVAGRRPSIPDRHAFSPTYIALLHKCWAGEPFERPNFSAIVDTLTPIS
eukprot:m.77111 g.77111  ORF g.77111 m.77111 type:complete len:782 (-) comp24979_c0_seq1:273-2618(-)